MAAVTFANGLLGRLQATKGISCLDISPRGGMVREAEWENGSWRHRVETAKMIFVIVFDPAVERMPADDDELSDTELVVVTGWRLRN